MQDHGNHETARRLAVTHTHTHTHLITYEYRYTIRQRLYALYFSFMPMHCPELGEPALRTHTGARVVRYLGSLICVCVPRNGGGGVAQFVVFGGAVIDAG